MARNRPIPDFATTAEVAEAAGVSSVTVGRWAKLGYLPEPTMISGGARGRRYRWPKDAVKKAAWIREMLDRGYTFEEIQALAARDNPDA